MEFFRGESAPMSLVRRFRWNDSADALALVVGMLRSKPLLVQCCDFKGPAPLRFLATITLEAFITSLDAFDRTSVFTPFLGRLFASRKSFPMEYF